MRRVSRLCGRIGLGPELGAHVLDARGRRGEAVDRGRLPVPRAAVAGEHVDGLLARLPVATPRAAVTGEVVETPARQAIPGPATRPRGPGRRLTISEASPLVRSSSESGWS